MFRNGSVLVVDAQFCCVYRGVRELDRKPGYICDIGLATNKDGIHFTKDTAHSPFFGIGKDKDFSFEDVCLVRFKGTYYLFCNVWDWTRAEDPKASGAFLATSKDMVNWTKLGLIFPHATQIHRHPVILQNSDNEPVKANGKFVWSWWKSVIQSPGRGVKLKRSSERREGSADAELK